MASLPVPADPIEPSEKWQDVVLPELQNVRGIWQGMGFTVSEEGIAEARREMWGTFSCEQCISLKMAVSLQ